MSKLRTLILILLIVMPMPLSAAEQVQMTLYKNPECSCCEGHAAYLRQHGYAVTVKPTHDLSLIKRMYRVPDKLAGCHTTVVGPYVVEGHVPAAEVKRLRNEVASLKSQIEAMRGTTALRPGDRMGTAVPSGPITPGAGRGVVRIVNDYPVEVSIIVNDASFRVPAGKTRDVEVPAGEFTYQLLTAGAAPTKSPIKEKEVVTLRIK